MASSPISDDRNQVDSAEQHFSTSFNATDATRKAPKTVSISVPSHASMQSLSNLSTERLRPFTSMYNTGSNKVVCTTRSQRLPSSPLTASPTQSEPSTPALRSASTNSLHPEMTPSRLPRSRARGDSQSRSASMPSAARVYHPSSEATTPRSSGTNTPNHNTKRSVKHLTCFWWKEKGQCRYSEDVCLYAHYDTGLYTDPPRQLTPGAPALAGKSLDRALKKIQHHHNKSHSSLTSPDIVRPATPASYDVPHIIAHEIPFDREQYETAHLRTENNFLRGLVEQDNQERKVLLVTLENLQAEIKSVKQDFAALKSDHENLAYERDTLQHTIAQMQPNRLSRSQNSSFGPQSNPFGVIGGEQRLGIPLTTTAELKSQNDELKNILRNYGVSF